MKLYSWCNIVIVALSILGCAEGPITTEYTWTQTSDGLGVKAPIVYRLSLRWSQDTMFVSKLLTDATGKTFFDNDEWVTFSAGAGSAGMQCNHFDNSNFTCQLSGVAGDTLESFTMVDGELTWNYWGDIRKLKKQHKVLGVKL